MHVCDEAAQGRQRGDPQQEPQSQQRHEAVPCEVLQTDKDPAHVGWMILQGSMRGLRPGAGAMDVQQHVLST